MAIALLRERPRAWVITAFLTAGSGSALISWSGGGGSGVLVVTAVQMLEATLIALPAGAVGLLSGMVPFVLFHAAVGGALAIGAAAFAAVREPLATGTDKSAVPADSAACHGR